MMEDWEECELNEICHINMGQSPPSSTYNTDGVGLPFFQGKAEFTDFHPIVKKWCSQPKKEAKEGDILLSVRAPVGSTNIADQNCAIGRGLAAISYQFGYKFIWYYLKSVEVKLDSLGTGTTFKAISGGTLKSQKLNLPPLLIQRAIVSKIESLFSSLDSGIADLKKAQEQLKIYRQAVLKKAFEGELTKEWREQQEHLPSAEELLEEIKSERENLYAQKVSNWELKLKEWKEDEGNGKKPSKPKVFKSVESFSISELHSMEQLPNEWSWEKLGNIFQVFVGSTPSRGKSEYWENGSINWVSSGEVRFNRIFSTKEKITVLGLGNASTVVHPVGTVMLAMIGEGKTRGQAAILEIKACHNQNTAAIRVSEMNMNPSYLFHYLFLMYERNRRVGSGNNQKALNQGRILNFDFPLCSICEQNQIVKEIESRLSVCDKVEKDIKDSLEKAQALRQSILKKAFEGKLLTAAEIERCKQEADYEPASVLLERIKKEKAS